MKRPDPQSLWTGVGTTLRLAVPLMAAQIAVVALGLVDTITFGQLGTAALAGGGLGTAVFSLIHIMCVGVLAAVGNEVAFAKGAGDESGIRRAVQAGAMVAVGLGTVAGLLTAYSPPLLLALRQDPNAVDHASTYLTFAAFGIVPSLLFTCLRGLTVSLGIPGAVTIITIAAVLFKAAANILIVVLVSTLPSELQTEVGLAWCGAVNAMTYGIMALAIWLFCRWRLADKLAWPRFNFEMLKAVREMLRLGLPIGATYGIEAGLFTGVALVIGQFGEAALAAHHVANQCVYLTFMLAVGLSHAASVQAGQAAGAGQLSEAKRVSRQALILGLMVMSVTASVFLVLGHTLADNLVGGEAQMREAIVDLAAGLLVVAACFQWADGVQNIAMGALRGLKDARATMIAATIGYWVIGLPAAWIFSTPMKLGAIGAWWGLALGLLTTSILLIFRFEVVTATPEQAPAPHSAA